MTETRTRVRNLVRTEGADWLKRGVTDLMKAAALDYYRNNAACNAAKRLADSARKVLYSNMVSAQVASFEVELRNDEGVTVLVAELETPTREVMDPRLLWEVLKADTDPKGREQFFDTVSATRQAVELHCSKAIAARIAVPSAGSENAVVRPKK